MAFLDNSGDIILDAVLTDAGRKRMAEGNFEIKKFALGDDEIDYSLYNPDDSRGSAYYDIDIFNTPILEAFTDNLSGLKTKLTTYENFNLLFLPVVKIETGQANSKLNSVDSFYIAVNKTTADSIAAAEGQEGILDGLNLDPNSGASNRLTNYIQLNQGIDNEEKTFLEAGLLETNYIIEIDDRLGAIAKQDNTARYNSAYVDDDQKAAYLLTATDNTEAIKTENIENTVIAGVLGSSLKFTVWSNDNLRQTDSLFLKIGSEITIGTTTFYYIDTIIKVTGVVTGFAVDIPVRFIKKK